MGDRFCEPILRWFRLRRVLSFIKNDTILLDIGCGAEAMMLRALSHRIKRGVGIDVRAKSSTVGNIEVKQGLFDGTKLGFPDTSFDCITLLAVIEHLSDWHTILSESFRLLKPGGVLIITVPTWAGKPVLEFLAFRLKIVSEEGVREHKRYYWKEELDNGLIEAGFRQDKISLSYFQFGLNLSAVAYKD